MTKVKFNWEFKISEDQEDLIVLLNGGVNCMIEIKHETFHKHLADKFFEIMYKNDCEPNADHCEGTGNQGGMIPPFPITSMYNCSPECYNIIVVRKGK
jgi:hypothetical protein